MANSVESKILNVANKKLKMERLVIQHGKVCVVFFFFLLIMNRDEAKESHNQI